MPVRVLGRHLASLLIGESLASLVGFEVCLDIDERSVRLSPLEGVAGVAVHVSVRVGSSSVRKEMHNLVNGLLVVREIVPEHGRIFEIGLGVSLLSVNEDGEVGRISEEEDRRVISHNITYTLKRLKSV